MYQYLHAKLLSFWQSLRFKFLNTNKKQLYLLQQLYRHNDGYELSKQDRANKITDDCTLVYGETLVASFRRLLNIIKPKAGDVFYDLGAGTGHLVLTAAVFYPFKRCVGIEILPSLYHNSNTKLQEFNQLKMQHPSLLGNSAQIKFLNRDFLTADVSDADIVFINATGFFADSKIALENCLNRLKPQTRVIITSKKLSLEHFELLHENVYPMTWAACSVRIYRKIRVK
ncbi:MAG: methyltransferase domain-containing protein [Pseudomonadota bacterium]